MAILKAGCFLINIERKEIAIVYREKLKDYTFPKGHVEEGETIEEAAIREIAEETKREAEIVKEYKPHLQNYITPSGEECELYMFIAIDKGPSSNTSEDTHPTIWVPFEEVVDKLSYDNLKTVWCEVKDNINKVINS